MKTILITGAAGFIGSFLSLQLVENGWKVIGIDNMNDYYDPELKNSRVIRLGKNPNFIFVKGDISDKNIIDATFEKYRPSVVVNLAAQAGVRYSIDHPDSYIQSNLIGFYNILENCRHHPVDHLVFASSSSVYGANTKVPFSTQDKTDRPVSLYAATKKSDELLAYSYAHLYQIPSTGLRFFTVYGPYGRPDMAYFSFSLKIMQGKTIQVFNNGDMLRDFTYIDDIIKGIIAVIGKKPDKDEASTPFKVYNIGNSKPVKLLDFIRVLEDKLGRKAKIEFLPMQPGDVYETYADVSDLEKDFNFHPSTTIETGLANFAEWFLKEYWPIS